MEDRFPTTVVDNCKTKGMNDLRILLVNPWIYDVAAYDYWLKPLGLLILAGYLDRSGHDLKLIDCLDRYDPEQTRLKGKSPKSKWNGTGKFNSQKVQKPDALKTVPRFLKRYGISKELFIKKLLGLKTEGWVPDAVFVTSAMTYWYPGPWEVIKNVKTIFPDTKTFLGGNYPNLMKEHALDFGADVVCSNSRIRKVIPFLRKNGIDMKPGIEGEFNLIPLYDLYQHETSHLVFLTSVGCPYRCTYCATPFLHDFKQEKPERLADSIERYSDQFKVRNIAFFDDAILVNHEAHFDVLLKEIINRGLPGRGVMLHLPNGIHARLLTRETARLMKRANVKTIKIALETVDEDLQRDTGSKVTTEEFNTAMEILFEAGFTKKELGVFLLVNLPGQHFRETIEIHNICRDLDVFPEINEYTPIPGTKEFEKVLETNTLPADWDPIQLNNTVLPFFWSEGFTIEEIEKMKHYNKKITKLLEGENKWNKNS